MKLIILNGCPAAGKSMVAEKLHQDLPMSLLADVDSWRRLISGWRENRKESLDYVYKFTVGAVDTYLQTGCSVIVDKAILTDNGVIDSLIESGKKHNAEIFEIILTADKDVVIDRANKRGFPEPDLLIPEWVAKFWDTTQKLIAQRSEAIVIDSTELDAEELYQRIKDLVFNQKSSNIVPHP